MDLLIDDMRNFEGVDVIARTYEAGMEMINLGCWDTIYIDHDLGEKEDKKNGYEIINFLLLRESLGHFVASKIVIVSSNPPGVWNISRALTHHGWIRNGNSFVMPTMCTSKK